MEIESRLSIVKKIIGLTLMAETVLFSLTTIICGLMNQLNWNGFLSTLLDVGVMAIVFGGVFVLKFHVGVGSSLPPGNKSETKILGCLPVVLFATAGPGLLAIVLSILIRLMIPR